MTSRTSEVPAIDQTAFFIFSLALLGSVGFFGYRNQPTEMGIGSAACLLGMILSRLDAFAAFKGLGIEAQLREVIRETHEVRATAHALGAIVIKLLAQFGLWGEGLPLGEKVQLWESLKTELERVGVRPEETEAMGEALKSVAARMHFLRIVNEAQRNIDGADASPLDAELKNLVQGKVTPTAANLRDLLNKHHAMTAELEERIRDLEHFRSAGKLRRPEIWGE